jgi:hypothetical protein
MTRQQIVLSIILSVIGLAVWIAISKMSHKVEAWDSINYYKIGLPIMFGASTIAGFIEPKRPWMWGLFVFLPQPIALIAQSRKGPLMIVGLLFFLVFIAVAIGCAYVGSTTRKYTSK